MWTKRDAVHFAVAVWVAFILWAVLGGCGAEIAGSDRAAPKPRGGGVIDGDGVGRLQAEVTRRQGCETQWVSVWFQPCGPDWREGGRLCVQVATDADPVTGGVLDLSATAGVAIEDRTDTMGAPVLSTFYVSGDAGWLSVSEVRLWGDDRRCAYAVRTVFDVWVRP